MAESEPRCKTEAPGLGRESWWELGGLFGLELVGLVGISTFRSPFKELVLLKRVPTIGK